MNDIVKQEQKPVERIGAIEAAVEGVKAIAPGLSLEKIFGEALTEGKRLMVQGAAEVAQSLFGETNAYVPYGRGQNAPNEHDNPTKDGGVHGKDQPQHDRGGREM